MAGRSPPRNDDRSEGSCVYGNNGGTRPATAAPAAADGPAALRRRPVVQTTTRILNSSCCQGRHSMSCMALSRCLLALLFFAAVSSATRRRTGSPPAVGPTLRATANGISWRGKYDTGRVEAYGRDSIRVRIGKQAHDTSPGSILETPQLDAAELGNPVVSCTAGSGNITNGDLVVVIRCKSLFHATIPLSSTLGHQLLMQIATTPAAPAPAWSLLPSIE